MGMGLREKRSVDEVNPTKRCNCGKRSVENYEELNSEAARQKRCGCRTARSADEGEDRQARCGRDANDKQKRCGMGGCGRYKRHVDETGMEHHEDRQKRYKNVSKRQM